MTPRRWVALSALLLAGCNGTTGSDLITFTARAGGTTTATLPLEFDSGAGFHVSLTRAQLHLGAVYLNQGQPTSGAGATSCVLPGIYVAEAFGPLEVDLLTSQRQDFPTAGEGTATQTETAEVWLNGGDINTIADSTVVLDAAGTATKGASSWPFTAAMTIRANRALPTVNAALPGTNPICHQRIVTPIKAELQPTNNGTLELRIDARPMFSNVDFSTLMASGSPPVFVIPDTNGGAGEALYKGVVSSLGVYAFEWSN